MEVFPSFPSLEKARFIDVRSGSPIELKWSEIHVSREGYLYAPNIKGDVVWVQWANPYRSGARNV